jgi:predicted dienelactone hydrolase
MKLLLYIFPSFLIIYSCSIKKASNNSIVETKTYDVNLDTLTLFDSIRNRDIPIAIYAPKSDKKIKKQQVIIFSHGYGENKGGDYLRYSYLTEYFASKGFYAVSIQHELSTDELLPMDGNIQLTRRPFWERGAENILFVLNYLKEINSDLDFDKLTLIGHSNGGDMSVLFAHLHPELVNKVISLDNRRMSLPRTSQPRIYTLRSNDFPADENVLPTKEEQTKFQITVQFTNINHSNMDNDATGKERKTLNQFIETYLSQ